MRPAIEVAAAGTAVPPAAVAAIPPGAAAMLEERPILRGRVAAAEPAAAASAARVFLFRLPSGRPHFRGNDGVAARPPSGRPRSCSPDPSPAPAPAPLVVPSDDIKVAAGEAEATVCWERRSGDAWE
jgi:hypothetical protein